MDVVTPKEPQNKESKLSTWQKLKISLNHKGLRPIVIGQSCCTSEIRRAGLLVSENLEASLDIDVSSANLLLVNGIITPEIVPYLKEVYDKMAKPCYVLAVGTCTVSGAVFETLPLRDIIDVDGELLGCPPSCESIAAKVNQASKENLERFLCQ